MLSRAPWPKARASKRSICSIARSRATVLHGDYYVRSSDANCRSPCSDNNVVDSIHSVSNGPAAELLPGMVVISQMGPRALETAPGALAFIL